MQTLNIDISPEFRCVGHHVRIQHHRHWIEFNRKLNNDAISLPNEAVIERRLEELKEMEIDDRRFFWLTLARIAELALKQAGDYTDNCEFQAAGDLLVNPRRIDIYRRGRTAPVIKNRHGALSEQFAMAIGNHNPVLWLSRETFPRIRTEALLPALEKMLSSSGSINPDYLAGLRQRMCKVTEAIAFLMAWQLKNSAQLYQRMHAAGPDDMEFIMSSLCNFDSHYFNAIGADIESIIEKAKPSTYFLHNDVS